MKSILPLPVADVAVVPGPHPDWMLAVKRHTDNIGAATQNLDVSRLRAEAVKEPSAVNLVLFHERLSDTGGHYFSFSIAFAAIALSVLSSFGYTREFTTT
jgi:hypothetical protein